MRKSITLLFILINFSLSAQNTKIEVLKEFLVGAIDIGTGDIDLGQPIITINELAEIKANKTILLDKENVKETLALVKNYKTCIVTVGSHTIIKITDFEDCSPSGAWGVCMPMGKGYIQKTGVLYEESDYIKNIIGRPDSQVRMVFLFN